MSLIINKVSSASTQVSYNYFESDVLFGYNVSANYTIDFSDITFTNGDGVLFEGIEALRLAYQQPNLVARIGTDEFINGRIIKQDFERSLLVGSSKCSITIEESKRLDDYSSHKFLKDIPSPQWIDSFQESFNFSRTGDQYSFSRNVSIKYKQDAKNRFIERARVFLREYYYNYRPNFGFQIDGISENGRFDGGFVPLTTEVVDVLELTVSLQENLDSSFICEDGKYSKQVSYSLGKNEAGYTEKKYSITINALKEPLEQNADEACKVIVDEILSENSVAFGKPFEISKGIDKDGGIIVLNISFSNDPSLNQEFTYTVTKTKVEKFYEYSITVEIACDGKNTLDKINKTRTLWLSIQGNYKVYIVGLFAEASPLYEKARSFSSSYLKPKITETVVYTTDNSYADRTDGIIKESVTTSISPMLPRIKLFVDPMNKHELVEDSGLNSAGSQTVTTDITFDIARGIPFAISYLKALGTVPNLSSDVITANNEGNASRTVTTVITS